MACSNLAECLPENPLKGLPAATMYATLPEILYFIINLAMYLAYATLIVFIGFNIFKIIYSLFVADGGEEDTYKKFYDGVKAAFICALGLVLVTSVNFFLLSILRLFGVEDTSIFGKNPFTK